MKQLILIGSLVITWACTTSPEAKDTFEVAYKGALKNIMHQGDIAAQADLVDLQDVPHLYALGAVASLKGEILILDSKPIISSARNGQLHLDHSFQHKATLLVYASIDQWKTFALPDHVTTYEDLEPYIAQTARKHGIPPNEPFPFLIEGIATSFDWHVIDWKEGDREHTPEKHKKAGLHGTDQHQEVEILGFYSDRHHAIFTHHSTNMHLHFKTKDNTIAGHLDRLILGQGAILKLPDNQRKS